MIVTVTQIKIKNYFKIFLFFRLVRDTRKQLENCEGHLFAEFKGSKTLTGWDSLESMQAFRNSGAHLQAMKNTGRIGRAKSVTWECAEKPSWATALEKLAQKDC